MKNTDITTLTIRVCGAIETPPATNRDDFRQGVIDTVLQVIKTHKIALEYVGYQPDRLGLQHTEPFTVEFSDYFHISFNVDTKSLQFENGPKLDHEELLNFFIEIFENKTHRRLEIDFTVVKSRRCQRIIEMSSEWPRFLKHG